MDRTKSKESKEAVPSTDVQKVTSTGVLFPQAGF